MAILLAPAPILSAYAFSVPDDGFDEYLIHGTHLRAYHSLGPGFAVAPLIVRGFKFEGWTGDCQFYAQDPDGNSVPSGDLGQAPYLKLQLIYRDPDGRRTTSITVNSIGGDIEFVELLDHKGRIVATRDQGPFTFAAPSFARLRVRGSGKVRVTRRLMPLGLALELAGKPPLMTLGLPVKMQPGEDELAWYIGGIVDQDSARERVKDGAPKQYNPMDRPFGALDGLSGSEETDRVWNAINALAVDEGLTGLVGRLVREKTWPWVQTETLGDMGPTPTGKPQIAGIYRQHAMQLAAADPGLARYLGFAGRTDQLIGAYDALSIFGLFALDTAGFQRFNLPLEGLPQYRAQSPEVDAYLRTMSALNIDVADQLQRLVDRVHDNGLALVPFETVIEACRPWQPPQLVSDPDIFERHWQPVDPEVGKVSSLYRASFAFPTLPMVSQAGLARNTGVWTPRNERLPSLVDQPDATWSRAVPLLFANEVDPNVRATEFGLSAYSLKPAPTLADHDIPDGQQTEYAVWASDMFGRFNDDARVFLVDPPLRPKPPKPVFRFHFERAAGEIAAGQSPGTVTVWVAVPEPLPAAEPFADRRALANAIVVPRLDDLPAGSFDLVSFSFAIDGMDHEETIPLDVAPGIYSKTVDVPKLPDPTRTLNTYRLYGSYRDSAGMTSDDPGEAHFTVRNFHKPVKLDTGTGLIWTSDPGPSPEVEVRIKWPSDDGRQYRVYLTDAAGMEIKPNELSGETPPSRGLVAKVGATKTGDRLQFRLLTDPPLTASGGTTYFTSTLPRTLETVQFLRVVPLGSDGDEFDFGACRVVAVAVPESRRPVAPLLDGSVDPATGVATLIVSTDELDETVLLRDEPGLFDPSKKGKEPPKAVIRRAVAGVADPIYAKRIGNPVPMTKDPVTGRYTATITDDNGGRGLEPWVKYVYWAEWQMPPERRLPAHTDEVAGAVEAVDPSANKPRPRPFSAPSAPRVVMRVPNALPAAPTPEGIDVTVAAGPTPETIAVAVTLADPPQVHKKAEASYRLALWTQWNNAPIRPIDNVGGTPLAGTWPEIGAGQLTTVVAKAAGDVSLQLRLAYVDPLGRMSAIATKST